MAYSERKSLISALEGVRGSRVITYILSDRETFPPQVPGFSTQIGSDAHFFFVDQLRRIGKQENLDLLLYTRGGATDAVWTLVSLLRERCKKLTVIVPFRAHSSGTLLCLGADEVIMTDQAELSPIDPTTGNQFNPVDPSNPQRQFGISVEDVAAYFDLSEKRAGITNEANKLEVLKELTSKVHPLALGNVQRIYRQIRRLAEQLLKLHMDGHTKKKRIGQIIRALTEEFYSHLHTITRREAAPLLGNWVRPPSEAEATPIWNLFSSYSEALQLHSRFNLPEYMGDEQVRDLTVPGGFIESTELSYVHFTSMKVIQRPNLPQNVQVQVPPGSSIPLVPWASRLYEYFIQSISWKSNSEGL